LVRRLGLDVNRLEEQILTGADFKTKRTAMGARPRLTWPVVDAAAVATRELCRNVMEADRRALAHCPARYMLPTEAHGVLTESGQLSDRDAQAGHAWDTGRRRLSQGELQELLRDGQFMHGGCAQG